MKSYKQFVFSFIIGVAFLGSSLFFSVAVNAQGVNDFVVESFEANYSLSNKDPQGTLEITEQIELVYSGQNRGILRAIPNTYKSNKLQLQIISVKRDKKTEPYITYNENENTIIRIGDADTYLTGIHSYEIVYEVSNVISFYETHDELYWDVNGNQWPVPFNNVKATVRYTAQNSNTKRPACYTGILGSSEQNCSIDENANKVDYATTRELNAYEGMSLIQGFEKGYFKPESWMERNWGLLVASPLFLLQLFVISSSYNKWKKYGRDYKKRGVIAPYFGKPKGLSVMQSGYVLDNKLQPKHITGAIIDLAIRNYIKIIESGEGRKVKHELELLRLPDEYTTDDEKILLKSLFPKQEIGELVNLENNKSKLYTSVKSISEKLDENSITHGYYEHSPKHAYKKQIPQIISIGILFLFSIWFAEFTQGASLLSGVVMIIFVIVFTLLMTKRSIRGNMLVDHMEGLKLYLTKAEKERLKMQDAVDAPLAKNSGQPVRDRDFFEKLLPYAVAMGVEQSWAKAFKDVYSEPPEWFEGNWSTFSAIALANSIGATAQASQASFVAPSSSGSSGFSSGGGFSGGGGGGGGGGGW
jgi:uncharacterized membrane protein YgcG